MFRSTKPGPVPKPRVCLLVTCAPVSVPVSGISAPSGLSSPPLLSRLGLPLPPGFLEAGFLNPLPRSLSILAFLFQTWPPPPPNSSSSPRPGQAARGGEVRGAPPGLGVRAPPAPAGSRRPRPDPGGAPGQRAGAAATLNPRLTVCPLPPEGGGRERRSSTSPAAANGGVRFPRATSESMSGGSRPSPAAASPSQWERGK